MSFLRWLPFGKVPELTAERLDTQKSSIQIVDVRTAKEFEADHIAGAVNLPITHFSRHAVAELELDHDKPVVAICLSAHRSIPAVRQLRGMGFEAYQLAGGMKAWWKYSGGN